MLPQKEVSPVTWAVGLEPRLIRAASAQTQREVWFIGMLQQTCLDYHYEPMNMAEPGAVVHAWPDKLHFFRPYESLGFLTPGDFSTGLGVTIPRFLRDLVRT